MQLLILHGNGHNSFAIWANLWYDKLLACLNDLLHFLQQCNLFVLLLLFNILILLFIVFDIFITLLGFILDTDDVVVVVAGIAGIDDENELNVLVLLLGFIALFRISFIDDANGTVLDVEFDDDIPFWLRWKNERTTANASTRSKPATSAGATKDVRYSYAEPKNS